MHNELKNLIIAFSKGTYVDVDYSNVSIARYDLDTTLLSPTEGWK